MNSKKSLKPNRIAAAATLTGLAIVPASIATQAHADTITDRIIQNVVQNILQDIRDQIQSRQLVAPTMPGRVMRFSGDDANTASSADDPFAALAYAKAPYTKAPPMAAPAPSWMYGLNLTGSGDSSHAAGVTTTSYGVTGAIDVTKIGVFSAYDAVSVILTGSGIWSNSPGINSNTGVGAGTVAYVNGGFSADFTIDGTWTSSTLAAAGTGISTTNSTGVSYAPNVQYKFELGNGFYIEPTVGVTYTQTFDANFGTQNGDSTEVHGGARFGTETVWNAIKVQPSLTLAAFAITEQTTSSLTPVTTGLPVGVIPGAVASGTVPTGSVGGRASGKLNFLWTSTFSGFVEAHGSGIAGTSAYGATGGLRWTF